MAGLCRRLGLGALLQFGDIGRGWQADVLLRSTCQSGQSQKQDQDGRCDGLRAAGTESRDLANPIGHLTLVLQNAGNGGKGGGAGELAEQFDHGFRVGTVFAELREVKDEFIGGQFPIGTRAMEGVPDDRIEPVQCLGNSEQPAESDVVSLQMGQFMEKHVAQFRGRKRFQGAARKEESRAQETEEGRAGDFGSFDDDERGIDPHHGFAIFQHIEHGRIGNWPLSDDGAGEFAMFMEDDGEREECARDPDPWPGAGQKVRELRRAAATCEGVRSEERGWRFQEGKVEQAQRGWGKGREEQFDHNDPPEGMAPPGGQSWAEDDLDQ